MRQFFKRLLFPIAIAAVTQTSIVSAESIRLIGPGGDVRTTPQFSSEIVRNRGTGSEPSRVIGPTSETDTLWSIATRLRPNSQVSVQQTLLAIYRLNPQAFEDQNIHSLIPGSTLRVPSLEQVSSVSTQEAVNVMAAHKARLEQQSVPAPKNTSEPVSTSTTTETTPEPEVKTQASEALQQPAPTDVTPQPEATVPPVAADAESEIRALEEKNHRLRLMLAEVQTEVSGLKQELGDEDRIRSEVEKLLAEERMKIEENQRLAPTDLDQLLSNNWVVAGLALIPGLLIALLVMMLLGRRSKSDNQEQVTQTPLNPTPDAPEAPIIAGDQNLDDLDEELLLDDDLFGSMDDSESLFGEEKEQQEGDENEPKAEESFADLDDDELDFDLEGEDGEDIFAAIDDSGDLDTDFTELSSSNSGISVSGEEKALGLEEMERTLDQASESEDDDDVGFDLSDDGEMSQADIESLLASDEPEELESSTLDQSMLDDLFDQQNEADDSEDLLNFDSLLDDEAAPEKETTAGITSDEELDDLFANIEAQADLEQLEADANQESLFEEDNTALLDDLLDEDSLEDEGEASDDEFLSELDDLLGESGDSDIPDFDENSTDLLDDFVGELSEEPEGYDSFLSDADSKEDKDEGLELFDELLDIEKSNSEEDVDFNSENFIDDLINSSPDSDPLLDDDEFDLDSLDDESLADDDFDFNPEIEGSNPESEQKTVDDRSESEPESDVKDSSEAESPQETEVIANEFGVPQDDDWNFEEDASEHTVPEQSESPAVEDPAAEQADAEPETALVDPDDIAEFDDSELPEYTEDDALAESGDSEPAESPAVEEAAAEQADAEPETALVDPDDILAEFDDSELPEYTEDDALAESGDSEPAESPVAEEAAAEQADAEPETAPVDPDDILAEFDDSELPEYTEDDALAESGDSEPAESPVAAAEQADAEPETAPVDPDDILAEFDDSELPEYTEDDALAESGDSDPAESPVEEEPAAEQADAEPETAPVDPDDILAEFDDSELPEYTEDDALAESGDSEPAESPVAEEAAAEQVDAEPETAPVDPDDILAEFDDSELPEYTEDDALAESGDSEPAESPAAEEAAAEQVDAEPEAAPVDPDDILAEFDDSELPEYTEDDALAESGDSEPAESPAAEEAAAEQADAEPEQVDVEPESEPDNNEVNLSDIAKQEFDEQALSDWLSDDQVQDSGFDFDKPMDARSVDSAGMDIDAMLEAGGEDWNGFNLTPDQQATISDEVPETEREAWQPEIQVEEPQVAEENWGVQDNFDQPEPSAQKFMTVDELMAQTEQGDYDLNPDEEELKLDVGLNEFPDVIGDVADFDVDNNAEAASKLDLAKIYIEMNDDKGAVKLLEEAIVDGSDDIRQQAKHLIDVINGRA